ncbi:RloB family protein [Azospirillum sp. Sh1]|uniref:RloB family protein n=1 Tax=Azospirillum sp. Sh1 TaxID=2607285 RepID=UPI0011EFDBC9|nr:RloB family protein [Azospirillum sp. Sh1]KAA0580850.1 RloB domain-containing protein [Azospirillum sp. Sh1]
MVPKRSLPALGRSAAKVTPEKTIVVFCEGERTEPDYLRSFADTWRNPRIQVEARGGLGDPKDLVELAKNRRDQIRRQARRDSLRANDEVWCLFDRDSHERVHDARKQARDLGIPVGFSNPCFEIWALFHFQWYDSQIDRHALQKMLRNHLPKYHHSDNPVFDHSLMKERYDTAKKNAERSLREREGEGKANGNPSTDVFVLLEEIRGSDRTVTCR